MPTFVQQSNSTYRVLNSTMEVSLGIELLYSDVIDWVSNPSSKG